MQKKITLKWDLNSFYLHLMKKILLKLQQRNDEDETTGNYADIKEIYCAIRCWQ